MKQKKHRTAGLRRRLAWVAGVFVLLCSVGVLLSCAAMGNPPDKERTAMYVASSNFQNNQFKNTTPVNMQMREGTFNVAMKFFFSTGRSPKNPLPTKPLTAADFAETPQALQVAWLGHSSMLLDIDGVRLLIDPVFDNASPVPFTVPRFQPSPITREQLPPVDAVVISHDHYDHLEMKTVKFLFSRAPLFIVPLGVGSHLEKWGCPREKIVELDWGQGHTLGGVDVIAAPSRHFSGRGLSDRFKTQWASFVFKGPEHSAFYSADGGYDGRFKAIGEQYGPFDLTMIEAGAWNKSWPDVHLFPEESVKAHMELRGKYMLPVHWGAYDLSFHTWDAPIEEVEKFAAQYGVTLLTPMMGELCVPGATRTAQWWKEAAQADKTMAARK